MRSERGDPFCRLCLVPPNEEDGATARTRISSHSNLLQSVCLEPEKKAEMDSRRNSMSDGRATQSQLQRSMQREREQLIQDHCSSLTSSLTLCPLVRRSVLSSSSPRIQNLGPIRSRKQLIYIISRQERERRDSRRPHLPVSQSVR